MTVLGQLAKMIWLIIVILQPQESYFHFQFSVVFFVALPSSFTSKWFLNLLHQPFDSSSEVRTLISYTQLWCACWFFLSQASNLAFLQFILQAIHYFVASPVKLHEGISFHAHTHSFFTLSYLTRYLFRLVVCVI